MSDFNSNVFDDISVPFDTNIFAPNLDLSGPDLFYTGKKREREDYLSDKNPSSSIGTINTQDELLFDDSISTQNPSKDIDLTGKHLLRVRVKWSPEMDNLLEQAVKSYGVGKWRKVAEYINNNMTAPLHDEHGDPLEDTVIQSQQCAERYKHYVDPSIKGRKSGPWSQEEIDKLIELVAENQSYEEGFTESGRRKTQVHWIKISSILNRHYRDCQHKYTIVSKSAMKTGLYTVEEEKYLLRRVAELGENSPGIWQQLEKETGRRSKSLRDKYHRLTNKEIIH